MNMLEASLPAADSIVETVAELLRLQGESELAKLLMASQARLEESDWDSLDGGTTYFTLHLDLPLAEFAAIEPRLDRVEKTLLGKVTTTIRNAGNQVVSRVVLAPSLLAPRARYPEHTVGDDDRRRIWGNEPFRLFLCHVAVHRKSVSALKGALRPLGVSAFVAHEDIEPSLEWQGEIELALRSMNALVALLTPEFKDSRWTDQEIGFALGRGVLVVPVKLGLDPHGFIAKHQGLRGDLATPVRLAAELVGVMARRRETGSLITEALVGALEAAGSFDTAQKVAKLLEEAADLSEEHLRRMETAAKVNSQVAKAFGLPEKISRILARHRA